MMLNCQEDLNSTWWHVSYEMMLIGVEDTLICKVFLARKVLQVSKTCNKKLFKILRVYERENFHYQFVACTQTVICEVTGAHLEDQWCFLRKVFERSQQNGHAMTV